GSILQERAEQRAAAAPDVDHAARSRRAQGRQDRARPPIREAHALLEGFLFGVARHPLGVGIVLILLEEPTERLARERRPVPEVATRDQVALGVLTQPIPAAR